MATKKKITAPKSINATELEAMKKLMQQSNYSIQSIGKLEVEKYAHIKALARVKVSIEDFISDMGEKYGDVSINPDTGEIVPTEATDKKES